MATEEITISELELADEVLGDMVVAVDTTSDTKSVSLRQLKAWLGSSLPTGFVIPSLGKINDERFTLLDGKTLARDGTYQAFCNKVIEEVQAGRWTACTAAEYEADLTNHGQCGKFVITNDYIRIPKLGNSLYSAEISGLCGVKGNGDTIGYQITADGETRGVAEFANYRMATTTTIGAVGDSASISTMNTSKFIGLTKDSTKSGIEAQVENLEGEVFVYWYMVVSTEGQTSPIEIDINEVYEDLNLKADIAYVNARMPTGTILPYGGATAPSGFLLCNGGAISRTTYADLFAVIGTTYGAGDGSTTFNLPNLVGLTSANIPVIGSGMALGITDGTKSGSMNSFITGTSNGMFRLQDGIFKTVGSTMSNNGYCGTNIAVGIVQDSNNSGIITNANEASQKSLAIIKY